MDYAVLTEFRQVSQRVLSAGIHPQPEDVRKLGVHATTLGASACAHELGFFSGLCERLHLSRYFPDSHRYSVLTSPSLQLSTKGRRKLLPTKTSEVRKLAAQFASLSHAWRDDTRPCVKNALSHLRSQYDFILRTEPCASELPVSLHKLVCRAADALATAQRLLSVISDGDTLLPVDEGLHAQWAVLRAVFTELRPMIVKATKLALYHDIAYTNTFRAKCDAFRTYVVNRDVELPTLDTPLGKGTMTRISEQLSPQLLYLFQNNEDTGGLDEDDEDDEDVEWDDEVALAPRGQLETEPLPAEPEEEAIGKALSPLQLKATEQKRPPWLSSTAQPELQTRTSVSSAIDQASPYQSSPGLGDRPNKAHNKSILETLDAPLKSDRHALTQSRPQRGKKKLTSARDRLSAKLGIKKSRRQRSYTLTR